MNTSTHDEVSSFQTGFALRPDRVFPVRSQDDVVAAVRHAADARLPVTVLATGHGLPGAVEGGVLISTRHMDRVTIDAGARTARVQAGVRWGDVVAAAAPHGLAPLNGSAPGVGAVSYTLGGGLGILAREFGYAADHVRSLDVVTGDGRPRHVTPDSELYWGLLGGGHRLGVVTELEIGLVPVRTLYGGSLAFDGREVDPAAALRTYEEWTRTVPDRLTSSFAAVPYPDLPALPPHLRGRCVRLGPGRVHRRRRGATPRPRDPGAGRRRAHRAPRPVPAAQVPGGRLRGRRLGGPGLRDRGRAPPAGLARGAGA